jgi:hypothetical protein
MMLPDQVTAISYNPPVPLFQHHFDGRTKWGDTIVGVSLGLPCVLYFYAAKTTKRKGGQYRCAKAREIARELEGLKLKPGDRVMKTNG